MIVIQFYTYIFYKSYFFCKNVLKEKEFPQIWAGSVVSFLIFTSVLILFEVFEYLMLPQKINIYEEYHKYIAVVFLLISWIFIHIDNMYIKILDYHKTIPIKTQKVFRIISILYYLLIGIGFFLMAELLRGYNIEHPR